MVHRPVTTGREVGVRPASATPSTAPRDDAARETSDGRTDGVEFEFAGDAGDDDDDDDDDGRTIGDPNGGEVCVCVCARARSVGRARVDGGRWTPTIHSRRVASRRSTTRSRRGPREACGVRRARGERERERRVRRVRTEEKARENA